jgi:hypothetical protein
VHLPADCMHKTLKSRVMCRRRSGMPLVGAEASGYGLNTLCASNPEF